MRNDWRVRAAVLLCSVLAAAGCSSTQPDSLGKRTASVRIITKAELVGIFNCYELWADDINGVPEFTGTIECYPASDVATSRSVPWRYSVSISVIPAGSTDEQIVTSLSGVIGSSVQPEDGIDNFISLSEYDPTEQPANFKPAEFRPGYGLVQFLNGKKVSRGNPVWLTANGFEVADTNILSEAPTFDFEVNSGDTVIVRARKQLKSETPAFLPPVPDPKVQISGTLSVGGALVSPTGTTKSSVGDGAGISFSFTVQ